MPSTLRPLSAELYKIAQTCCNENSVTTQSYIAELQTWMKKSPQFKTSSNMQLLLCFLRRCHFDLERTKIRIKAFYSLKDIFPEIFHNTSIDNSLIELHRTGIHIIPKMPISSTGARIILCQFAKCNSNPDEMLKLLFILLEILAIEDDNANIAGLIFIIDFRDATVEQALPFELSLMKKIYKIIDQRLPLKISAIYVINARKHIRQHFTFLSAFLASNLPFKIHKRAEDLYKHIPRDVMTVEYGGHNGYQAETLDFWEEKLKSYTNYFLSKVDMGHDSEQMKLKFNNVVSTKELHGVKGTFRKLQID